MSKTFRVLHQTYKRILGLLYSTSLAVSFSRRTYRIFRFFPLLLLSRPILFYVSYDLYSGRIYSLFFLSLISNLMVGGRKCLTGSLSTQGTGHLVSFPGRELTVTEEKVFHFYSNAYCSFFQTKHIICFVDLRLCFIFNFDGVIKMYTLVILMEHVLSFLELRLSVFKFRFSII